MHLEGSSPYKGAAYRGVYCKRILVQEVVRPLSIDERTLILATAVSIDFDYFSQHSHGSGMLPFAMMPVPYPSGGGGGEAPANAPDGGQTLPRNPLS
jgi:hypothetical protein